MRSWLFLTALCVALSSCDSFPVEREGLAPHGPPPKVSSIDLPAAVDLRINFGGGLVFPEGAYTPFAQSSQGTFYHSATHPHTRDLARWMEHDFEGGLFLRDDMALGLQYWIKSRKTGAVTIISFEHVKIDPKPRYHMRDRAQ